VYLAVILVPNWPKTALKSSRNEANTGGLRAENASCVEVHEMVVVKGGIADEGGRGKALFGAPHQMFQALVRSCWQVAVPFPTRFRGGDGVYRVVVRGISLPLQNIFDGHCV
jgi:hypothetical protein